MKKITLLLFFVFLVSACSNSESIKISEQENKKEIAQAEKGFTESGQNKAVENKIDLWQFYSDEISGLNFKYPHNTSLGQDDDSDFYLRVEVDKIDGLDGTMGFDSKTAEKNKKSLSFGEYGENVDWPFELSKNVRKLGEINAQDFMVFSRFEVCSVLLEHKLYFFKDGYQIIITLSLPVEKTGLGLNYYLTTDLENCADEKIWKANGQKLFYQGIRSGKSFDLAQSWYDSFFGIISSIDFDEELNFSNFEKLQGAWKSLEDEESVIVFADYNKKDIYDNRIISDDAYKLLNSNKKVDNNGDSIEIKLNNETLEYRILKLTKDTLELSSLPRGNVLKYTRK